MYKVFITIHGRIQEGLQRSMAYKKLIEDEDEANISNATAI